MVCLKHNSLLVNKNYADILNVLLNFQKETRQVHDFQCLFRVGIGNFQRCSVYL
jgi:hypothetical protein